MVADAGVRLLRLTGDDITATHINHFYRFYMSTIDRKWGGAYLTEEVFHQLHASMADRMLLVMAEYGGRIIGGAFNFIGEDTLFGRNWGPISTSPACISRPATTRPSNSPSNAG